MKLCKIFYKIFIALSICFLCIEQGVVNISVQSICTITCCVSCSSLCRGILSGVSFQGYALRCSFQGIIRGHDSYVIGRFRCNPLKLLKFAFVVTLWNCWNLHSLRNTTGMIIIIIYTSSKISTSPSNYPFPAILRPIQGAAIPCPILPYPRPLSTPLMALYLSLSTCP